MTPRDNIRAVLDALRWYAQRADVLDARRVSINTDVTCRELRITINELHAIFRAGHRASWRQGSVMHHGAFNWVANADWSTVSVVVADWAYNEGERSLELATDAILSVYNKNQEDAP